MENETPLPEGGDSKRRRMDGPALAPPPPPPALPTVEQSMATVWPEIGKFLGFLDTVRIAKTCTSLRGVVVVGDGKKVAVSHLDCYQAYARNEFNLDGVPHYMPRALRAVHFPTLKEMRIGIPLTRGGDRAFTPCHADYVDFHTASFPYLADNLASACNLEKLLFSANAFETHEEEGRLDFSFRRFGEGLLACTKLRSLIVTCDAIVCRDGRVRQHQITGLLQSLLPTIAKNRLTTIDISLCGDPVYDYPHHSGDVTADFLTSIVAANAVERLGLYLNGSDWAKLAAAAREAGPQHRAAAAARPANLKSLSLSCNRGVCEDANGLADVLSFFAGASSCLESVELDLPLCVCHHSSSAGAVRDFLDGCRSAYNFHITFGGREGTADVEKSRAIGDVIASFVMQEGRVWSETSRFKVEGFALAFRESTVQSLDAFFRANAGYSLRCRDADNNGKGPWELEISPSTFV